MRAMSLTQPWCGLVASGIKLVENRDRSIVKREDFGKPFALHATREIKPEVYHRIGQIAPEIRFEAKWNQLSRITSAVIGVATIDRVVVLTQRGDVIGDHSARVDLSDQRRWLFGPIGYVLRDVRALKTPVPCKGSRGFWTLTEEVERAVMAQIGAAP